MRRVFAWFRSHPLTTIFLVLIGFALGTHLFSNWRAEVRWQRYCAAARARGVKLTLAEFAPPEIPDAENFAALPMFRAIFTGGVQSPMELPRGNGWPSIPNFGDMAKGERLDWKAWQKHFKDVGFIAKTTDSEPQDVLLALDHYAPQIKEWSEWRTRPRCQFPLDWKAGVGMLLPHCGTLSDATKLFSLRMRAHLALGDPAMAYMDFQDGFQTYRALQDETTTLSAFVQRRAVEGLCRSVGDGLMDRAWTDSELRMIEMDLATVRLWHDYRRAFASERAANNTTYDAFVAASPTGRWNLYAASLNGRPSPPAMKAIKFIPKRVFRDNQLRHNQWLDEILSRVSNDASRFDPDKAAPSGPKNWSSSMDLYYFFLFRISTSDFSTVDQWFVFTQTLLDETHLAIALERFRMARGAFPEKLAELAPDFIAELPVDTYSRQPLIYRRKDGGTFLLYGVGKNRTDDGGGTLDSKKSEMNQIDDIWLYAPPPSK